MKTAIVAVLLTGLLVGLSGCDSEEPPEGMDQLSVLVSIQPQVYFAEQIGGQFVDAQAMVAPGHSPATYEPTPAQMSALSMADMYFTIGVPFEKGLLPKIRELHPELRIIDTRDGIDLRPMQDDGHDHGMDPHVWLDPTMAKGIARNMADALTEADGEKAGLFSDNLVNLQLRLDSLDAFIRRELEDLTSRTFYVFHPAYGYFAEAYGLNQVAVEIEGKEPSARRVAEFIEQARADSVRVIIVQPQFSTQAAETIAEEVGAEVLTIDPLAYDYFESMKELAEALSTSLGSMEGE